MLLFQIVLAFLASKANAQQSVISISHDEVLEVVEALHETYPPSDFIYVGIGRSPTVITTYLKFLGSEVYTFPLSSFRSRETSPEKIEIFGEHWSEFVPETDKKIVLIDFSDSGQTLLNLSKFLEKTVEDSQGARRRKSSADIYFFVLAEREMLSLIYDTLRANSPFHFEMYPLSFDGPLYRFMLQPVFEAFAPFLYYNLFRSYPEKPEPNSIHDKFAKIAEEYYLARSASTTLFCSSLIAK